MKIKDKVCQEFGWKDYDNFSLNEEFMDEILYNAIQELIGARLIIHYMEKKLQD